MPIPWNDVLSTTGTVASACAAGFALLTARRANQTAKSAHRTAQTVAAIEVQRWHSELTPRLSVTLLGRHGQYALHVGLDGPTGLDRLDSITVVMEDETGVDRTGHALLGGSVPLEELQAVVWSPFRFRPHTDGTDEHGRSPAPFPLRRGEWRPLAVEVPPPPRHYNSPQLWESQYEDKPIRLRFECQREGRDPWTVPYEIPAHTWRQQLPGTAGDGLGLEEDLGQAQPDQ
ncbi:hypothetical protein ABT093_24335 [Kitasatospora sp. NPDC002551]|uniref:hypothetical protein n=1 Tax=Kitasatospora sp. NPDC002551 TaxID=3154539 RepID=UPI00331F68E3